MILAQPMNHNYWKNISKPDNEGFSSRLNSYESPINFLFIKDSLGNIGFGIKSNIKLDFKKPKSLKIIDIFWKNKVLENGDSEVYFILNQSKYEKEFQYFCTNIIVNCKNLKPNDDHNAIRIMIERLEIWKNLFEVKRELLSEKEQMGLFGELHFIREFLRSNIGIKNAILSWEDGEQDFEFNGKLFEVKSQNAASDSRIIISSLQQLNTESGDIFLVRHKIGKKNNSSEKNESLNQIVSSIIEYIKIEKDSFLLERFEMALFERNYIVDNNDLNQNYIVKYLLNERIFYEVNQSFPSITPEKVDVGVIKASYEISEIVIEKFIKKNDYISKILKDSLDE